MGGVSGPVSVSTVISMSLASSSPVSTLTMRKKAGCGYLLIARPMVSPIRRAKSSVGSPSRISMANKPLPFPGEMCASWVALQSGVVEMGDSIDAPIIEQTFDNCKPNEPYRAVTAMMPKLCVGRSAGQNPSYGSVVISVFVVAATGARRPRCVSRDRRPGP